MSPKVYLTFGDISVLAMPSTLFVNNAAFVLQKSIQFSLLKTGTLRRQTSQRHTPLQLG